MTTQLPPLARSADRPLNIKEQAVCNAAMVKADGRQRENLCAVDIQIGVFFDGTNNNKKRDQEDVLRAGGAPHACSHSNVVVLHDAFQEDIKNGFYRFYVPGVGTPFPEIGELSETTKGKAQGAGGDSRINWALIQVLNAMHQSIHKDMPLTAPAQAGEDSTGPPTHFPLAPDANCGGKRQYFSSQLSKLKTRLASRPPKKLTNVTLHVFGFSRGAAQARAFCHFLEHSLLQKEVNGYTLAGVPFRLQFLGLFDSVASVGMADASPFWRGLGGWANGTLDIAPCVERTVHLVAAHEIRINFPLSSVRIGPHKLPRNAVEKVYPGSHSDVGGGYAPGSQGKSVGVRSKLLSQIPLLDMYREARVAGVPLLTINQLLESGQEGRRTADDLDLDRECANLFNAYLEWSSGATSVSIEQAVNNHMQLYWQWRYLWKGSVHKLPSYARATEQDRIDVWESDGDFASDELKALRVQQDIENAARTGRREVLRSLTAAEQDLLRLRKEWQAQPAKVPPLVHRFFDEMVHDSHASFYMAGAVTAADRAQKIKEIGERRERYRQRLAQPGVGQVKNAAVAERMADESLSDLERRIHEYQKTHKGEFPPISDKDREQLLAMEDLPTSAAVRLVTNKTRRELGGHVRYRRVLDES